MLPTGAGHHVVRADVVLEHALAVAASIVVAVLIVLLSGDRRQGSTARRGPPESVGVVAGHLQAETDHVEIMVPLQIDDPIAALTQASPGLDELVQDDDVSIVGDPGIDGLAEALLTETWTVGRLEGAELTQDDIDKYIAGIDRPQRGEGGTSMYYDRLAGRPVEQDAIYGSLIRAAERHGVEVPMARAIQALLVAGDPRP